MTITILILTSLTIVQMKVFLFQALVPFLNTKTSSNVNTCGTCLLFHKLCTHVASLSFGPFLEDVYMHLSLILTDKMCEIVTF